MTHYKIKTSAGREFRCAGSGSTAIAAINTKRKFICFEKDEKIYKTCRERVINTNAQISFV